MRLYGKGVGLVPRWDQGQCLNPRAYETLVRPLPSLSMPYGSRFWVARVRSKPLGQTFFYSFISQEFPSAWGAVSVFLVSTFPDAWMQERGCRSAAHRAPALAKLR